MSNQRASMETIRQDIQVSFRYDVHFTKDVFSANNDTLADVMISTSDPRPHKIVVVLDGGLLDHYPDLEKRVAMYLQQRPELHLAHPPVILAGGEEAKNDPNSVHRVLQAIYDAGLCRHSFVIAIGGGSIIDVVGYAAGTAHRGIRLIRVPTTVLSQNDAAVGVKNGVNAFDTKNFLGTFAPPFAVLNDAAFLHSLEDRDWRSGISEAVKVALLKDADFFAELERNADRLSPDLRDLHAMSSLIYRCAELHLEHIATSGDPFEMGSSRPLDFGHWAAHQLEQLTRYELRHGEAVAIGIALDVTYSHLKGMLEQESCERTLQLLEGVGFDLYVPELGAHIDEPGHPRCIFQGLDTFREHLGGELTIMLLEDIGRGVNVHEVDRSIYRRAVSLLRDRQPAAKNVA
ncbi:MAG: 3-dehydroquinate synthase [Rhodothermales bacterium]